jgi:hypothetical protein
MLDVGATTFWEDFDVEWLRMLAVLTNLCPRAKKTYTATTVLYCYKAFAQPLSWLGFRTDGLDERARAGIQIMEPGCKVVRISPNLADLSWAEGTYPTPHGIIRVASREDGGWFCQKYD